MKKTNGNIPSIILFEDDQEIREMKIALLEKSLKGNVSVLPFKDEKQTNNIPTEVYLENMLSVMHSKGGIGLIVCDRELGNYKEINIISESVVTSVAEKLGLPICLYERKYKSPPNKDQISLDKYKRWIQKEIIVTDDESFGLTCAGIYKGFTEISAKLESVTNHKILKLTPAALLAKVLDKEEETDRIALYGAGEQGLLQELMPYYLNVQNKDKLSSIRKRYPRILGNWLYNSILRFPGILANEVATASYLSISPADFERKEVQQLFHIAEYTGPFHDCGRWWWRKDLDGLLNKANCKSGLEYAVQKGCKRVHPCKCVGDGKEGAGYYCMMREKPVCEKHSRGGIICFPAGADLSRFSLQVYKKIGPFVGLY